jgi:hypothetical protein
MNGTVVLETQNQGLATFNKQEVGQFARGPLTCCQASRFWVDLLGKSSRLQRSVNFLDTILAGKHTRNIGHQLDSKAA